MFYIVRTPTWVKKIFKSSVWQMDKTSKSIYLTFDDGPHPLITPFVLQELKKYNARATFFCIGKNVLENPELYDRLIKEGHAVGNHTHNHLDGWKTENAKYLQNILTAAEHINSRLFRPPYGRITRSQHIELLHHSPPFKVIMWSILSGDFDVNLTAVQCAENVLRNAKSGSVVVFHDSEKASDRLRYALPTVLKYFSEKGYTFEKIDLG